jgi:hypothetical protein
MELNQINERNKRIQLLEENLGTIKRETVRHFNNLIERGKKISVLNETANSISVSVRDS